MGRTNNYLAAFAAEVIGLYALAWVLLGRAGTLVPVLRKVGFVVLVVATVQTVAYLVGWCVKHHANYGLRYALTHARLAHSVRSALAGTGQSYSIAGQDGNATLPRVRVELDKDLGGGAIQIRSHIKYASRLANLDLSSAIGRYIVEEHYISPDGNWYIYEFRNGRENNQLAFWSYPDFVAHAAQNDCYTFFMDKRNNRIPLSSLLLVGATGSGKTYALYSLILQMVTWAVPPKLYFSDPKLSSLYVLGEKIAPDRTAGEVEEIINQLRHFHREMTTRKLELQDKLREKLDADYRRWRMPAHILIIDEFAGFQRVVATMDKATRDEVSMYLRNIVLQGRQLGFFLWVAMQKSGSDDIPTAIRDNLPWKVVLGTASNTTYITAFEESANLPRRNYGPGQGLYSYQGLTRDPKVTSFPTLNFDVLRSLEDPEPPVM